MEKILLIFKDKKKITKNHEFWNDKLSLQYDVEIFFLHDYLNLTNVNIIKSINKIINNKKIKYTLFEGDHNSVIDKIFIDQISNNTTKGIFLGDDQEWHDVNKINSFGCDFVFTCCPISELRFKEYGVKALFIPIEANGNVWKDYNQLKDIDVSFFGRAKKIRDVYFKVLKQNNINVLIVDPYSDISNTNVKLAKLINRSKIVLNFSISGKITRFWNRNKIFDYWHNFKGRIYMASFCNSLCITEQDPAASLIFSSEELPQFDNLSECIELIKKFLKDQKLLEETTKNFHLKGQPLIDINYIKKIKSFLTQLKIRDKKDIILQYWYLFIHLRQSFRLRFKKKFFLTMIAQYFENFSTYKKTLKLKDFFVINIISTVIFFSFLILMPFKFLKK